MNNKPGGIYYPDYLQLDKLLDAQHLESAKRGQPAHDEMLFIVVHQAYELWFKQILYEIRSIIEMFSDDVVDERQMGRMVERLERVHAIQRLLVDQIDVMETMTPLDFLEFRDLLVPASGFQSVQFKELEVALGIKREMRLPVDQEFIYSRLSDDDRARMEVCETQPSLAEKTEEWLERLPFLNFEGFDFWKAYGDALQQMLMADRKIIEESESMPDVVRRHQLAELEATQARFQAILDEAQFAKLKEEGQFRLSHRAILAALFIHLYRDEPALQLPFRYLTSLMQVDELLTTWRSRHVVMVHRMLGGKIGTGGSSGHDYLRRTTNQNRAFMDLFNLSTFLIRRSDLPVLPKQVVDSMGYRFSDSIS